MSIMKQSERPSYRLWYAANRTRLIAKAVARRRAKGRQYSREIERRYYIKHREQMRAKGRRDYARHRERRAEQARAHRRQLREEFIIAYGGECACCGEQEHVFLTLEHKNRDGKLHRNTYGTSAQILADLKRRGWPKENYELLCFNCNRASWELGICPHRKRT